MDVENFLACAAHVSTLPFPAPFCVMQGIPGDGMANTMDRSLPTLTTSTTTTTTTPDGVGGGDEEEEEARRDNEIRFESSTEEEEEEEDASNHVVVPPAIATTTTTTTTTTPTQTTALGGRFAPYQPSHRTTSLMGIPIPSLPSTTVEEGMETVSALAATTDDSSFIVLPDNDDHGSMESSQRSLSGATTTTTTMEPPHPTTTAITNAQDVEAIRQWDRECRELEVQQRLDMLDQSQSNSILTTSTATQAAIHDDEERAQQRSFSSSAIGAPQQVLLQDPSESRWWQWEGRLLVFQDLPERVGSKVVTRTVVGDLAPGSTVVGRRLVTSTTSSTTTTTSARKEHVLQFLEIESPLSGYVLYADEKGYPFLGRGLPAQYMDPQVWLWRVTCLDGAYVREGLSLQTSHICTIPHGSLIRVMHRVLNAQGIPRLRIQAASPFPPPQQRQNYSGNNGLWKKDLKQRVVEGWISECLNPQSGQRGFVAQPVPFPVPALVRVELEDGALVRAEVELSSHEIGWAPRGTVLAVTGRQFSEHPAEQCVERWVLAGQGGWISARLNRPPPLDELLIEFVGIDGTFCPSQPGLYHLQAQRRVQHETTQQNNTNPNTSSSIHELRHLRRLRQRSGELSSIDDDDDADEDDLDDLSLTDQNAPKLVRTHLVEEKTEKRGYGPQHHRDDKCLICLTEERNATIVHGGTGHIACCLACSRILQGRGDKCPVCRKPIDMIIQQFWA